MKIKLATLTTLLLSFSSYAATNFDGIWTCQLMQKNSTGITQHYLTIHSHPDGQTVFGSLKESIGYDYFGYGIGTIIGNNYRGSTKYATPFNLTMETDNILTGTMQGGSGSITDHNAKCVKIW